MEKEAKNIINKDKKYIKDNWKKENPISFGEKQRLAVVRVLENHFILYFDEATSSLDKNNEIEFKNFLNQLAINKISNSITKDWIL